jgi:TatD DNase family protein
MQIIDTHAHLDHLAELDRSLTEAYNCGVAAVVAMSMNFESCQKNIDILSLYKEEKQEVWPKIYLALGMHPAEANLDDVESCLNLIRQNQADITAIGEVGLDFWYKWVRKDKEKKDIQRKVFRSFLEIAKELDLPIVVHSRGTWKECFELLQHYQITKGEFHWYSGPADLLKEIVAAGYRVSTTPSIAYSEHSRLAMQEAPLEQTLIETDCPVFFRTNRYRSTEDSSDEGFESEPRDVWRTLEAYCEFKGLEEKEALEKFNANARKFFNL